MAAARTDPLRAALHARIIAAGEFELSAPPLEYKIVGPRLLAQSMAAINHIVTCGMAYRLTGDVRFAERARRDMLTASAFVDWHPSHFLDVAEMALAVGIGYDWLYPYLQPSGPCLYHQEGALPRRPSRLPRPPTDPTAGKRTGASSGPRPR